LNISRLKTDLVRSSPSTELFHMLQNLQDLKRLAALAAFCQKQRFEDFHMHSIKSLQKYEMVAPLEQ
jgi:hypothetical protein